MRYFAEREVKYIERLRRAERGTGIAKVRTGQPVLTASHLIYRARTRARRASGTRTVFEAANTAGSMLDPVVLLAAVDERSSRVELSDGVAFAPCRSGAAALGVRD